MRAAPYVLLAACGGPADEDLDAFWPDDTACVPAADAGPDVVVLAGARVTLAGVATCGAARWVFGDGTTAAPSAEVTHAWAEPGNYVAALEVSGRSGTASDTVRVLVHLPPASPPPRTSSSLAVADDGTRLAVAVPEADRVVEIDLATRAVTPHPTCTHPRTVAYTPAGLAAACEDADAVWVDGQVVALGTGTRPYGVVATATGLAVGLQGSGEVAFVAGATVTRAPLGDDPRALAVLPDGAVWATRLRSTDDVGAVLTEGPPIALAHDPGPDSDTGNRGVPTALRALAVSPDAGTAVVGGTLANVDRGAFRDGQDLGFDVSLRATLRVVDVPSGTERFVDRKQLDNHGQVSALAFSPLGAWLWMAHPGTHTVTRLDGWTLRASGVILDAGAGIDALAVSPDGGTLFVYAWLDREVRAYDVAGDAVPATPAWTVRVVDVEPLAPDVLRGKRLFHDSRDRRLARDGYLTCNTCHPDGRDDGVVWDFTDRGEGLRNTISLEGRAGTGMGPVHWTGNFDEIHDFEGDIRNGQGGTGLLSDADWAATSDPLGAPKAGRSPDLDALAAYVASLDRTPTSPYAAPPDGAAAFDAAGCAACHPPGTAYTDSALDVRHDVGTATAASGGRRGGPYDGFDTPTLLGAFATGPWLHDGSAPTLEAAIRAHAGTASLSDDDLALLAAFVRSL